jgi:hypothetical protein
MNPAAKSWNQHVMSVYREMKARKASTRLGDAMKAAKKTWKKSSVGGNNMVTRKNRKSRSRKNTRRN